MYISRDISMLKVLKVTFVHESFLEENEKGTEKQKLLFDFIM